MGIMVADEEHDPLSAPPLLPAAPSTSAFKTRTRLSWGCLLFEPALFKLVAKLPYYLQKLLRESKISPSAFLCHHAPYRRLCPEVMLGDH